MSRVLVQIIDSLLIDFSDDKEGYNNTLICIENCQNLKIYLLGQIYIIMYKIKLELGQKTCVNLLKCLYKSKYLKHHDTN